MQCLVLCAQERETYLALNTFLFIIKFVIIIFFSSDLRILLVYVDAIAIVIAVL